MSPVGSVLQLVWAGVETHDKEEGKTFQGHGSNLQTTNKRLAGLTSPVRTLVPWPAQLFDLATE